MREEGKDSPVLARSLKEVYQEHPYILEFFDTMSLPVPELSERSLRDIIRSMDDTLLEQKGLEKDALESEMALFINNMQQYKEYNHAAVESLTIIGGRNKSGQPENVELQLKRGDIVSIVGPTGSGKSRLLADIEWLAQEDTPTGRRVLINGHPPDEQLRFSIEHKMVAQLSQNMNFVMDLSVGEFIQMHAGSRMVSDVAEKKQQIIAEANKLAGEPLYEDMPITSLSGGQSRALMIADTAFLSHSPIVLIDEIENAGIDKKMAVDLLIKEEKIVLIATHDPLLALRAQRRVVIKNGGIHKIIASTAEERACLEEIEGLNDKLMEYRKKLRNGEVIV